MATLNELKIVITDSGQGFSLEAEVAVGIGSGQFKHKFTDAEMPLTAGERAQVQAVMDAIRTKLTAGVKAATVIP
jgi:hypothetical protein